MDGMIGDELGDDMKAAIAEHDKAVRAMAMVQNVRDLATMKLRWAKIGVNVAKQRLEAL